MSPYKFVWNFYEFTPFHVIYPVCRPTKETCDTFGIVYDIVELNQNEMSKKNNRILDKLHEMTKNNRVY